MCLATNNSFVADPSGATTKAGGKASSAPRRGRARGLAAGAAAASPFGAGSVCPVSALGSVDQAGGLIHQLTHSPDLSNSGAATLLCPGTRRAARRGWREPGRALAPAAGCGGKHGLAPPVFLASPSSVLSGAVSALPLSSSALSLPGVLKRCSRPDRSYYTRKREFF